MIFNMRKNILESATEDIDSTNDITTDERDENILIDANNEENNAPDIIDSNSIQTEGAIDDDDEKIDPDDGDFGRAESMDYDPADPSFNAEEFYESTVLNEKYGIKKFFGITNYSSRGDRKDTALRDEVSKILEDAAEFVKNNKDFEDKIFNTYNCLYKRINKIIKETNKGKVPAKRYLLSSPKISYASNIYKNLCSYLSRTHGFKAAKGTIWSGESCYYKIYGNSMIGIFGSIVTITINGVTTTEFDIYFKCVKNSEYMKEFLGIDKNESVAESAINLSSNDEDDFNTCEDNDECIEKEKMTPENLYGFDDHLTDCDDTKDEDITEFRGNPEVMQFFTEYYDITNRATRRKILSLSEAEQNSILTSITSKLYDKIVAKTDDIDYGEIPNTKGDITKLSNYKGLIECIDIIRELVVAMKQDTAPIDILTEAIANISARKDLFERGFRTDSEVAILMYNNYVLAIVASVSLLISTSIEFIKTPNKESFDFVLDKMAYTKNKNYIFFTNLKKFNKACKNGDLDKSINSVIDVRTKHEAAAIAGIGLGGKIAIGLGIAAGSIGLLLLIPNLLKEIVFVFYHLRVRASDYFNTQADLLEMNAYRVANNTEMDQEKKNRIVEKQTKKVGTLRKIANFFSIKFKKAEVDTNKEIAEDAKTKNTVDNSPELANPDTAANSALF